MTKYGKRRGRPPGSKNKPKPFKGKSDGENLLKFKKRKREIETDSSDDDGNTSKLDDDDNQLSINIPNGHSDDDSSSSTLSPAVSHHSPRSSHDGSFSPHGEVSKSGAEKQGLSPPHAITPPSSFSSVFPGGSELRAFWRPPEGSKAMYDNVLITDVTTDSGTITVRECLSDGGFSNNSSFDN